jgi:hypothetical protein
MEFFGSNVHVWLVWFDVQDGALMMVSSDQQNG